MKLRTAVPLILCLASVGFADDGDHLLRLDHYVQVHSTVPASTSSHLLLFNASLEWLTKGTVQGKQEGLLRLGY